MRVGIIAEGRSDFAVLCNILKGAIGLDREFVTPLRPELHLDETDLHDENRWSNWELVRKECLEGTKIEWFLKSPIDEPHWIVIHIDADEAAKYGVARPADRREEDVEQLREGIVAKIREWLGVRASDALEFAVAVEETEAWVLPLYRKAATDKLPNAKERLLRALKEEMSEKEKKRILPLDNRDRLAFGVEVSAKLRKPRELDRCAEFNTSLKWLVAALRRRAP